MKQRRATARTRGAKDAPKSAGWKRILDAWLKSPLPSGRFAMNLHDTTLLSVALSRVLKQRTGRVIVVASDQGQAERIGADLRTFLQFQDDARPLIPLDELTLGKNRWVPENESGRSAALAAALSGEDGIFLTTAQVLLSETLSPKGFSKRIFTLKKGQSVDIDALKKQLVALDYDNEFEVQQPGEFAHRGGILDIYSPLYEAPVRLELWGDEIDTMRFFLPDTQRSFREIDSMRVVPRGMAILDAAEPERARVHEFFDNTVSLVLCGPELIAEHLEAFADSDASAQWKAYVKAHQKNCVSLLTSPADTSEFASDGETLVPLDAVSLAGDLAALIPELGTGAVLWHWKQLRDDLLRWKQSGYTLVACCAGDGEDERLRQMLKEDASTAGLEIETVVATLSCGVMMPHARLILLSDQELFGRKTAARRHRHINYARDMSMRLTNELEEGGYAVHAAHGICRYLGIKTIESKGELQEVMTLEFADAAMMYVPLEQAHLVSRYMGAGKAMPVLSHLHGSGWKRAMEAAGDAARDLAAELLRIEAMRQQSKGISYKPNLEWERAFVGSFPYTETPDQLAAIEAVLDDMGKPKPMDRLLCGDVGYGKTEVAMRAAFRAVVNGRQVAVLVPTTILCQQHYDSFQARMNEFPVKIEMLSRFKTQQEQRDILARTARGEVDIIIGTHRLLSPDVSFASLGLVVIDEEQRFGVEDKQKLKKMRANVDILSMSATPIPRTLYFSLSGIRNLSTIMTAPTNRLPVTTIVSQYDTDLIKQAILREMERDGQVFLLHNRVQTIAKFALVVQALVPNARIEVAHARMNAETLENIMLRFVRHEFDVLVCTTIIESGIDIPNANTIIIDRADRFGLSELYQLRGRVGRTDRQAYAYLLLPPMGALPSNARERLEAIRRFTHLGAGFKLALRDLEIRGAGNILGTEQSGHIAAVGFDMYCQLLKEAVARLEKDAVKTPPRVEISFDTLTFAVKGTSEKTMVGIPDVYVGDQAARVECYRDVSRMMEENMVDAYRQELTDRFGTLPSCTEAFLELARLRILAQKRHISRILVRDGRLIADTPKGLLKDAKGRLPELHSTNGLEQLQEAIAYICKVREI